MKYGDQIKAFFAVPHPTKRGEYVAETLTAKVIGFSHPNHAKRNWGWRGSVMVEAPDGRKVWNKIR